jgi:hypothetical protein
MLLNFKEWLSENMWGNIPVKGRKPSDGPPGAKSASGMTSSMPQQQQQPMNSKMKKKMKK